MVSQLKNSLSLRIKYYCTGISMYYHSISIDHGRAPLIINYKELYPPLSWVHNFSVRNATRGLFSG